MRAAWLWLRNSSAVLVVLAAFLWSAITIYSTRRQEVPPGTKVVLRIGHWQLESGVRDAIQHLAAEYQKLHPEVTIVQDQIPEGTYGTWLTTQLMGGTAPDILEPGMISTPILIGYYSRYFLPLTPYVDLPNPYNAGSPLEGVAWRKTFKDGMRNSYIEELQEFMTVPLSQFGIRVFYNRDLLKQLTGRGTPPGDFREFLAVCEQIKRQKDRRGEAYIPIAGSGYHFAMWESRMAAPLTYGAVRVLDFNRDSTVSMDEFYAGFMTGRIGFDFPPYAARFQMVRRLAEQFQSGWTGLGRDEAVFLFAQQRAVFITTGTWDVGGLREQAAGTFSVGVINFPMPGKNDPEFGAVVEGPVYELPEGGFPFAITRTCQHPEVALDFLQFLSSRSGNEQLNRIIGWIPSVTGASVVEELHAFEPHLEGVFSAMPATIGGDTAIKWQQMTALFNVEQIDYPAMAADYAAYYRQRAPEEFAEMRRNRRRALAGDEKFVAAMRSQALAATGADARRWWTKYRILAGSRLVLRDLNNGVIDRVLATEDTTKPYAFRPEALANVRARLATEQGGR